MAIPIKSINTVYNSSINFEDEIIYFLLVDRFHDGKIRFTDENRQRKIGFGTEPELDKPYGGNIKGIIKMLDYIKELGCTALWISPVFENNEESYHGYAIQNFLKVDKRFGTKNDLKQLVKKAHQKGISVYLDVVINHSGNNWHYQNNRSYLYSIGNTFPFGGWKKKSRPLPRSLKDISFYERKGMISNWDDYPETQVGDFFSLKKFKLDESDKGKQVQNILAEIYCHWIKECDFDGFRLDTAKHMTPTAVARFCTSIKNYARSLGKTNFPIFIEAPLSDLACSSYFNSSVVNDPDINEFPNSAIDFQLSYFLPRVFEGIESPDKLIDRWNSIKSQIRMRGLMATYLVTFLDNHDQIESLFKQRIANRLNDNQLIACFGFLLFYPGIPCLYYGSEQGLTGHGFGDKYIREAMFCNKNNVDLFDNTSILYKNLSKLIKFRGMILTSEMKDFGVNLISMAGDNFKRKRKYNKIISYYRKQNNGIDYIYCYNIGDCTTCFSIKWPNVYSKIEIILGELEELKYLNNIIDLKLAAENYVILRIV